MSRHGANLRLHAEKRQRRVVGTGRKISVGLWTRAGTGEWNLGFFFLIVEIGQYEGHGILRLQGPDDGDRCADTDSLE
jgi:hypothetical protein